MIHSTLKEFSENIDAIFENAHNEAYITVNEFTEATFGNQNDCDLEWAAEHNIPVYDVKRDAGTAVYSAGNVEFAIIFDVKNGWICPLFTKAILSFLKSKIDSSHTIEIDHNDVMIDGYKTASCTEFRIGKNLEKIYSSFQLSVNQDMEAIKHICKKEMVKIPRGLSDFGITTEDVVEFCENWFNSLDLK